MARIGIVSIYDVANYGNRLQSYALSEAITALGHDAVVVRNHPFHYSASYERRSASRDYSRPLADGEVTEFEKGAHAASASLPARLGRSVARLPIPGARLAPKIAARCDEAAQIGVLDFVKRTLGRQARKRALTEFSSTHLSVTEETIARSDQLPGLPDEFDAMVVGSDQVWNPAFRGGFPLDFLPMFPPRTRIAYAPSIGVRDLSPEYQGHYERMLEGFGHPSAREHSGAELISDLMGGTDVPVVLDPTMLLPREQWSRLADDAPAPARKPFVAVYALRANNAAFRASVKRTARREGLGVVDLLSPRLPVPQRNSVPHFVRAIRDAEYVVTDSFHATVFSLLFAKPAAVLSRSTGQDDRARSLFDAFGIDPDRGFSSADVRPTVPLCADPSAALAPHIERSQAFLRDALADALS